MATKKRVLPKTWAEFCKLTGRNPKALPDTSLYDEDQKRNAIANFKLSLIIKYCNGDKQLDYTDNSPIKYEIWWNVIEDKKQPSGLGLSCHVYVTWTTLTGCGPRFAFIDRPTAEHVAKHFLQDFIDLYC